MVLRSARKKSPAHTSTKIRFTSHTKSTKNAEKETPSTAAQPPQTQPQQQTQTQPQTQPRTQPRAPSERKKKGGETPAEELVIRTRHQRQTEREAAQKQTPPAPRKTPTQTRSTRRTRKQTAQQNTEDKPAEQVQNTSTITSTSNTSTCNSETSTSTPSNTSSSTTTNSDSSSTISNSSINSEPSISSHASTSDTTTNSESSASSTSVTTPTSAEKDASAALPTPPSAETEKSKIDSSQTNKETEKNKQEEYPVDSTFDVQDDASLDSSEFLQSLQDSPVSHTADETTTPAAENTIINSTQDNKQAPIIHPVAQQPPAETPDSHLFPYPQTPELTPAQTPTSTQLQSEDTRAMSTAEAPAAPENLPILFSTSLIHASTLSHIQNLLSSHTFTNTLMLSRSDTPALADAAESSSEDIDNLTLLARHTQFQLKEMEQEKKSAGQKAAVETLSAVYSQMVKKASEMQTSFALPPPSPALIIIMQEKKEPGDVFSSVHHDAISSSTQPSSSSTNTIEDIKPNSNTENTRKSELLHTPTTQALPTSTHTSTRSAAPITSANQIMSPNGSCVLHIPSTPSLSTTALARAVPKHKTTSTAHTR